ncbi:MAG: preprotein translocase subunit YajC [Acidocella sp.]|uniref:preprotein translocase subunit YajC n=1 Tax=Acidocella sp. TaxID=50710 RepID=UPI003FD70FD7
MFITPAYAQTAAAAGASTFVTIVQWAPILLMAAVFYFLLIMPQQKQQKQLKAQLATLKRGDKVVTSGGIVGTVKKAAEGAAEIDVEIAPNVTVSIVRSTISSVVAAKA